MADDEPGRTPEQRADDIATDLINDALQQSHWKQVDHRLVLQTLIKKLTEQLSKTVIPLSAEESADARKAAYAAQEQEATVAMVETGPATKKRGRPPGSKNKPKEAASPAEESPPATDNLDIPPYLRRDQQNGSIGGTA